VSNRLIYLLDADARARGDLAEQIGHYGYGVSTFASLETLREAVAQSVPAVIVAAMDRLESEMHISEIQRNLNPSPCVVFLGGSDEMQMRLRSVRFGGSGFFSKPVNVDALVTLLDRLTSPFVVQAYRILIVESDGELSQHLVRILGAAGMETHVVSNPAEMLRAGDLFHPELILMNLYYPEILGMELATVLRQDPRYERIPIVFLSSELDPARQMAALAKGGDDCLTLPIHPDYLALIVASRVEATRSIKSLYFRDGLTGLLNHRAMLDSLEMKLELAGARGVELPFVMVDIDRFKLINDTYGHPVGDTVLKSLGRLLKQRVWSKDLVGRLGGEEFGVIVNSMDAATAARVFNEIRIDFAQIRHTSSEGDFYATFSCGVAWFPRYATSAEIESAAERAVRQVKALGGNRVGLIGRHES